MFRLLIRATAENGSLPCEGKNELHFCIGPIERLLRDGVRDLQSAASASRNASCRSASVNGLKRHSTAPSRISRVRPLSSLIAVMKMIRIRLLRFASELRIGHTRHGMNGDGSASFGAPLGRVLSRGNVMPGYEPLLCGVAEKMKRTVTACYVSPGRSSNLSRAAMLARSGRLRAHIFRMTWPRCAFTVTSLISRSNATCLLRRPLTTAAAVHDF